VKLQHHFVISAAVAGGFYGLTRSWPGALICWLSGFLIDLDHVIDYVLVYRRLHPGHFFTVWHTGQIDRIYLIAHGWEWVVVLAGLTFASGCHPWLAGLTLGIGHHLVIDQLSNNPRPFGYSFFWRLTHGCSLRRAFRTKESEDRVQ